MSPTSNSPPPVVPSPSTPAQSQPPQSSLHETPSSPLSTEITDAHVKQIAPATITESNTPLTTPPPPLSNTHAATPIQVNQPEQNLPVVPTAAQSPQATSQAQAHSQAQTPPPTQVQEIAKKVYPVGVRIIGGNKPNPKDTECYYATGYVIDDSGVERFIEFDSDDFGEERIYISIKRDETFDAIEKYLHKGDVLSKEEKQTIVRFFDKHQYLGAEILCELCQDLAQVNEVVKYIHDNTKHIGIYTRLKWSLKTDTKKDDLFKKLFDDINYAMGVINEKVQNTPLSNNALDDIFEKLENRNSDSPYTLTKDKHAIYLIKHHFKKGEFLKELHRYYLEDYDQLITYLRENDDEDTADNFNQIIHAHTEPPSSDPSTQNQPTVIELQNLAEEPSSPALSRSSSSAYSVVLHGEPNKPKRSFRSMFMKPFTWIAQLFSRVPKNQTQSPSISDDDNDPLITITPSDLEEETADLHLEDDHPDLPGDNDTSTLEVSSAQPEEPSVFPGTLGNDIKSPNEVTIEASNVPADGNCLLYAIEKGLVGNPIFKQETEFNNLDDMSKAQLLREKTVDWLNKNRSDTQGDFPVAVAISTAITDTKESNYLIKFETPAILEATQKVIAAEHELNKAKLSEDDGDEYAKLVQSKKEYQDNIDAISQQLKDIVTQSLAIENNEELKKLLEDIKGELESILATLKVDIKKLDNKIEEILTKRNEQTPDNIIQAKENLSNKEKEKTDLEIDRYLELSRDGGFYCGHPQIMALSKLYDAPITVYNPYEKDFFTTYNKNGTNNQIMVRIVDGSHFQFIDPDNAKLLKIALSNKATPQKINFNVKPMNVPTQSTEIKKVKPLDDSRIHAFQAEQEKGFLNFLEGLLKLEGAIREENITKLKAQINKIKETMPPDVDDVD